MDHEIYVNKPLSSQVIMELLDKHPDVKKIKCPNSLYVRTSKKYLDALSELGIEVEPVLKRGRPKKYGAKEAEMIHDMLIEGSTPKEISQKLDIPLKTVYYLKDTKLKRGRKPKYSKETYKKNRIQLRITASCPTVQNFDKNPLGDRVNFYARKSISESFGTSNQTNSAFNPAYSNKYVFTTADVKWI